MASVVGEEEAGGGRGIEECSVILLRFSEVLGIPRGNRDVYESSVIGDTSYRQNVQSSRISRRTTIKAP